MTLNLRNWTGGLAVLGGLLLFVPLVAAKDAPKPKAPPSDWRKYIFEDIKAPTPRPKSMPARPFGLQGSSLPAAKDAPKPPDPPSDWRKYIFEDIKTPPPRPKSLPARPLGLQGSSLPAAKDAPKPTDPPSDWRHYVKDKIKAPKPRPKPSAPLDPLNPFGPPKKIGAPPPQTRLLPLPSTQPSRAFPPKRPPYVHPPRDIRDLKGKPGPLR